MRNIKFRTWDPFKKIYRDFAIAWNPYTNENYGINGEENHFPANKGYIFEQFVGLTDKYNKPIFEGDIVKWNHPMDDIGVVEYCSESFSNDVCYYGLKVNRFGITCQFQTDDIYEIIGNIHENSNLIKS